MKVLAPAKINLYLHILGKRPDGYHELETLMCPVDLADTLEFTPIEQDIQLTIRGADTLSSGSDNLIHKAASLFLHHFSIPSGIRIEMDKQIPMGGGLGGGSSNAAAVLAAMNQLFETSAPLETLATMAARLGSDVPFFLHQQAAICKGRGEIVEPTELHGLPWLLLINPGFGVPTPWAYQTYAAQPASGTQGKTFPWNSHGVRLRNDLEPPVFSKYLWIHETKLWLQNQPEVLDAMMSGSGATVFALVSDEQHGLQLERSARQHLGEDVWIRLTRLRERFSFFQLL